MLRGATDQVAQGTMFKGADSTSSAPQVDRKEDRHGELDDDVDLRSVDESSLDIDSEESVFRGISDYGQVEIF